MTEEFEQASNTERSKTPRPKLLWAAVAMSLGLSVVAVIANSLILYLVLTDAYVYCTGWISTVFVVVGTFSVSGLPMLVTLLPLTFSLINRSISAIAFSLLAGRLGGASVLLAALYCYSC
jgi:hypothetical protein